MDLDPDFRDLLQAFAAADARYLVVGGYAVAFHGAPRFTKDIDLWIDDSPDNLRRVRSALEAFGAPAAVLDRLEDAAPEDVLWMGLPPMRADIMKSVPGGRFSDAYAARVDTQWGGVAVRVIGLDDLIDIKRASGRSQDLADVGLLERYRTGR